MRRSGERNRKLELKTYTHNILQKLDEEKAKI
jgi:hypothetical protein